jgi:hypothetical protein
VEVEAPEEAGGEPVAVDRRGVLDQGGVRGGRLLEQRRAEAA